MHVIEDYYINVYFILAANIHEKNYFGWTTKSILYLIQSICPLGVSETFDQFKWNF